MIRLGLGVSLHKPIDRSAKDLHKPRAQSKRSFSAALAGVAGCGCLPLVINREITDLNVHRERLGGDLNQVDIAVTSYFAGVFAP